MDSNIIYYFVDPQLTAYKHITGNKIGCKIGSTCNYINRFKTYRTGWSFIPHITIFNIINITIPTIPTPAAPATPTINNTCYYIDAKINQHYADARLNMMGSNGGTEFYDSSILTVSELKKFFTLNNIQFIESSLTDADIAKICSNKLDINYDTLKHDNTHQKLYYNMLIKQLEIKRPIIKHPELKPAFTPRDYQHDIINKSIEYYKTNDKGVLVLICGVGKTLLALWISVQLNVNKILIGVPNTLLLKQWDDVINGRDTKKDTRTGIGIIPTQTDIHSNKHNILIVNKDCNKETILKVLKEHENCIIITTYHSSNKILDATNDIPNYTFDMKIYDECHHLTTSNMLDANTRKTFVRMLQIKSIKQLALTATLKQIEPQTIYPNIISNENKEYFGDIIDKKNMLWAINKKIICDYNIQTFITDDLLLNEIITKFNITCTTDTEYNTNKLLVLSAYISLKSIIENHTHHLLIYTNKQENADLIIECIDLLYKHKYFEGCKIFSASYHSNNTDAKNTVIMNNFSASDKGIITCVYSLGEGWDFPKLDGVVFAEGMSSNIRIVQSALRASRKNSNMPDKIAKLIIPILYNENWLDSNNDDFKKIKEIIYQLSLEDETILTKIKVLKLNNRMCKCNNMPMPNEGRKECICKDGKTGKKDKTDKKDIQYAIGEYQHELTEKLKLHIIPRHALEITYEKARKIIQDKNIKNITKDIYIELCDKDIRLPKKPDEFFKGQFNWIYYLSIERIYYDLKTCKNKVDEYLLLYPEMKKHYLNLSVVSNELCKIDALFPPNGLWVEYYNVKDLRDIITITNKKKIMGVIL